MTGFSGKTGNSSLIPNEDFCGMSGVVGKVDWPAHYIITYFMYCFIDIMYIT